jgi:polysaccharide export outer membrane protein
LIFRSIGGQRYAARFDLRAIRAGRSEDPLIRGNDVVVVGASQSKAVFRDLLASLPGLGTIFIALQQK